MANATLDLQGFERATELYTELFAAGERYLERFPDDVAARQQLARAQRKVGQLFYASGQVDRAIQAFRESLESLRAIAEAEPDSRTALLDGALALRKVGDTLLAQGRPTDALKALETARSELEGLFEDDPQNVTLGRELSAACFWEGTVLQQLGRSRDGMNVLARSVQALRELRQSQPENHDVLRDLVTRLGELANQLMGIEERADEFETIVSELADLSLMLLERNPNSLVDQDGVVLSQLFLATIHTRAGNIADADSAYAYALEGALGMASQDSSVLHQSRVLGVRDMYAQFRLEQGDASQARDWAEENVQVQRDLARANDGDGNATYTLGSYLYSLGKAEQALGHAEAALDAFEEASDLCRELLTVDSRNSAAAILFANARRLAGAVFASREDRDAARSTLLEARAVYRSVVASSPGEKPGLDEVERLLQALDESEGK